VPTRKIVVNVPNEASYDVRIGQGILGKFGQELQGLFSGNQVLLITDSNVSKTYLKPTKKSLVEAGFQVTDITVPAGETSKSIQCAAEIWNAMAEAKLSRDACVVALGGGVVGDIAGLVASTYMRGILLVQAPTSLLAMVDSSVGGKTGINLEAGKNLVGTFKQPAYVCASIETLATLPEREWLSGFAEVAKSAVIDSDEFFFWLTDTAPRLMAHDFESVAEAVARSVVFKANTVALDVREEKGYRESLNYGHTLGHAIELCAGYGTFSHGQAVAEGMRFAARLGAALVGTSTEFIEAQDDLLDALGLTALGWKASPEELLDAMLKDKKVRAGALRFVLPCDVGDWVLHEVDTATLLEHLRAWQESMSS